MAHGRASGSWASGGAVPSRAGNPRGRLPAYGLVRVVVALGLLLGSWAAPARENPGRAVRTWLSDLVTRIDAVDRAARRPAVGRPSGTVVVHVEVAADGTLLRTEIERGSGSPELDRRALRAVLGVGPLPAPPPALLGGSGFADLSIPVELGR